MAVLWSLGGALLGFSLVGIQASRYDMPQASYVYLVTMVVGAGVGWYIGSRLGRGR